LVTYNLFEGLIEDLGKKTKYTRYEPNIEVKKMESIFGFTLFN